MFRNLINKIAASSDLYKQLDRDAEEMYLSASYLISCARRYMEAGKYRDNEELALRNAIERCRDAVEQYDFT